MSFFKIEIRRHGQVVRQRSATPLSPVRIWVPPRITMKKFFFFLFITSILYASYTSILNVENINTTPMLDISDTNYSQVNNTLYTLCDLEIINSNPNGFSLIVSSNNSDYWTPDPSSPASPHSNPIVRNEAKILRMKVEDPLPNPLNPARNYESEFKNIQPLYFGDFQPYAMVITIDNASSYNNNLSYKLNGVLTAGSPMNSLLSFQSLEIIFPAQSDLSTSNIELTIKIQSLANSRLLQGPYTDELLFSLID